MIISYIFIFGLIVGSFLNVLIDRIPKGKDIVFKPSHCDHCRRKLMVLDLIPLFSFIFLRGRCRYCRTKISLQNPLVELSCGFLFVYVFSVYSKINSDYWLLLYQWTVTAALIVIFTVDLKKRIIPDQIIVFLTVITFIYQLTYSRGSLFLTVAIGFITAGVFLFLVLITRGRGMGLGDVKYAFFMGYYLSWPKVLISFYLAFLTGALLSLILVIMGRKSLKSTIAFGPFLVVATFIADYYGGTIISYFHKYFF